MSDLAIRIKNTEVEAGSLAIFWLGQAGFVYKTPSGTIIYVDAYLSNCVNRLIGDLYYGFKRIMTSPIEPAEVEADWVVCTHSHPDHFDFDAIPILAQNPDIRFAGAPDCDAEFRKLDMPAERYTIIEEGTTFDRGDFSLTGVYADHGELAPDALGVVIQVGDIKVWQVGDTAYRPEKWQDVFEMGIDVIIPPINGAFGNLDGVTAAKLTRDCGAKVSIPCHYWMFAEHGGDPAQFLDACKEEAPDARALLMAKEELFIYSK